MPELVHGKWVRGEVAAGELRNGAFEREPTRFRESLDAERIGTQPGRLQLFVAHLCPWACRALVYHQLKTLGPWVRISVADTVLGEDGWTFSEPVDAGPGIPPVHCLHELYTASKSNYSGKVSVPVLWDRHEARIINNESADIIRIFNHAFDHLTGNHLDLVPPTLRETIDSWNHYIYHRVNNGVYRAGFARSQTHYDTAVTELFDALDLLETHLASNRYLAGEWLTEADWRLFTTLIRFDAAYHGVFKCNIRRLEEYASLSGYVRELYQWPDIRQTVDLNAIRTGYYSIRSVNPTGIVPMGPLLDFEQPHGREYLPSQGIADAMRDQTSTQA